MKYMFVFLSIITTAPGVLAQTDSIRLSWGGSPYLTSFKTDGPVTGGGIALAVLGLNMIMNKNGLTDAELLSKKKSDINVIDRFSAGYYSEQANSDSYIPFYVSFAMPVISLLNKNTGRHSGQVLALYLETMAITGAVYTLTAGSVIRARPLVYNTNAPNDVRKNKSSQRSFFAGHTAATAAAAFFTAKIFSDFNPESAARPYIWAGAAALPAGVAYLRLKAGQHFLSDNLIGYAIGAATGVLIPQLHKRKNIFTENVQIQPLMDGKYQGLALIYDF